MQIISKQKYFFSLLALLIAINRVPYAQEAATLEPTPAGPAAGAPAAANPNELDEELKLELATEPDDSAELHTEEPATTPTDAEPAPDSEPALSPQQLLEDAQQRFTDYYEEQLYSLAIVAAGQAVELTREIYGERSVEAGLALSNLAKAQSHAGDQQSALTNYEASVFLIEESEGIISPQLGDPLLGLAETHNAMGDYDQGLLAYERALRINHVEQGLFNIDQMEMRDGMTESYIGLGDMDKAEFQQEVQTTIVRQEYVDDLDIVIPAMFKLAKWYRKTNQPLMEQQQYQIAINIVRSVDGKNSTAQIEALRGLSSAYMQSNNEPVSTRILKQAYRINEESDAPDTLLSADILVQLGDNYNSFGSSRDAYNSYVSAWKLLAEREDSEEQFAAYFGTPTDVLIYRLPELHPDSSKTQRQFEEDPASFLTGNMQLSFDVDSRGRVENIIILEADPADLLDKRVKRLVSRYIYRPRMVDGQPVTSNDIRLIHSFRYRARDVQDEEEENENTQRLEFPGQ